MTIVSGRLFLREGSRDAFLEAPLTDMTQARKTHGCRDFVVAGDPIDPDRVHVYEEWESEESLLAFRGEGPSDDLLSCIVGAEVHRHMVSSSAPP